MTASVFLYYKKCINNHKRKEKNEVALTLIKVKNLFSVLTWNLLMIKEIVTEIQTYVMLYIENIRNGVQGSCSIIWTQSVQQNFL